jgi:glutathione S-transferase
MSDAPFKPVVYLKAFCPFSQKIRILLLEAGLVGKVEVRDFTPGSDEEQAIRSELAPHFEKMSIPAALIAPGHYIKDSDAIVAKLAETYGVDLERLPTLKNYIGGAFKQLMDLYKENRELKQQPSGL